MFAIGDCVNTPWLAHVASAEGLIAVETIAHRLGKHPSLPATLNYDHTPSCVYSEPPVAWSGLTEEEARKRGHDVKIGRFDFAKNAKAAIIMKKRGFVKFVVDQDTDEILGCHMIGPNVADLLSEVVLAMEYRGSAEDIGITVHSHSTLSETVKEAALSALGRAIHM